MKRSEINKLIVDAEEFIGTMNFKLPPFVSWSPEEWQEKGHECDEIRDNMLGWDITDFGSGDFQKIGLLLITLRNGNLQDDRYVKPYAEKLLIVEEDQITPFHFHWHKMEDIINRGGGNLLVQVYNSLPNEEMDKESDVTVMSDGRKYQVKAGSIIRLTPGESITVQRGLYHQFWGEKGTGKVLLGEVSQVNDDHTDNRFYRPAGRFPDVEEDEKAIHLLVTEYPAAKD